MDWPGSPVLRDGMDYVLRSGGKRLRPLLCLKMCDALGGNRSQARVFARAIETYHNFTLVHDDILDGDRMRRETEAAWVQYGLPQGIDIGDALHAQAYTYLIENRELFGADVFSRLLAVLNEADRLVMDGQSLDLAFRHREKVTVDEYMNMVEKKTGALLSAALQGAGIIADVDASAMTQIEQVGRDIGPAFQIRDDVLDVRGGKGRGRGNDIREGKYSLMVVEALQNTSKEDRGKLVNILAKEREETTDEDVEWVITLFERLGAVEQANTVARERIQHAVRILEDLSDSYAVNDLLEITTFLVERKF